MPAVSVLIGLVSTEDRERILQTLESLATRQGSVRCEVVLVDRRQDEISEEIARRYPKVRIIPCAGGTPLPEMRTMSLDASSADIVAVTEDHCVPARNWLQAILAGMANEGVVAVGGPVENGVDERPFDWATFLCEYSYFHPPLAEGPTDTLPGMNVAYRRASLASMPRELLVEGFWETTVHPTLRRQSGGFVLLNAMRILHCKRFSFRLFSRQRYVYSRYYAGIRFRRRDVPRRLAAAVLSFGLPPLLLWRMYDASGAKGLRAQFWRALPSLAVLVVIWNLGELVGYLAGPGRALAEIE